MKRLVAAVTLLSALGFLLAAGAWAQLAPGTETSREPTVTRPSEPAPVPRAGEKATPSTPAATDEMYASKIIGASVKNTQGESLGKVDELVIDPHDARIKAAVVSVGGLLGIGAKSVEVPWDKVKLGSDKDRDTVVIAMGKEELEQAPGWQKSAR